MRPRNEPNLRQLDPRLPDLHRRAGGFADTWIADGTRVGTSGGDPVCVASTPELARYLRDLHTHFLPVLNQLLYRLRGAADLEKPSA
jgi:hypothetical protein